MYMGSYTPCKYCGKSIYFEFGSFNVDGTQHKCTAFSKVKIYTKEEIAKLNKERGLKMKETNENKDLEWQKQDQTENIQKSVNPDGEYMKEHNLCQKCHGIKQKCNIDGCPN